MLQLINTNGKFIQRYNIKDAIVEKYYIPASNLAAYFSAKSKQDLNANYIYGIPIQKLSFFL